jgi:hypothetical protein
VGREQREKTSSAWLSVLPLAWEGFDLSGEEFRDKLNMRHGRAPLNMPSKCDGCGEHFTIEHALSCKVGGNVKHGHDQLRDQTAFLLGLGFSGVRTEPCTLDRSKLGRLTNSSSSHKSARTSQPMGCGNGSNKRSLTTASVMPTQLADSKITKKKI